MTDIHGGQRVMPPDSITKPLPPPEPPTNRNVAKAQEVVDRVLGTPPSSPDCPECGGQMSRRVNKKRNPFWGCDRYPACQGLIDIQESFDDDPIAPNGDWRWRRDTARDILKLVMDHIEYWQNDVRSESQIAIAITDDLIERLK